MVRANVGVREGHWYFEIEILPPPIGGSDGHVRVGWAAITGELQAPVGLVSLFSIFFSLHICFKGMISGAMVTGIFQGRECIRVNDLMHMESHLAWGM